MEEGRTREELEVLSSILKRDLEESLKSGRRGISPFRNASKTYTLMQFAKEHGCIVIVRNRVMADLQRRNYPDVLIYGQEETHRLKHDFAHIDGKHLAVYDDGVFVDKLFESLKSSNIEVITGYLD